MRNICVMLMYLLEIMLFFTKWKHPQFCYKEEYLLLSHILFNNFTSLKAKQHTIWKWNFPKVFSLLICFSFSSLCYSGMLPYSEMCNSSPGRKQMVWLICLLVQDLLREKESRTAWDGRPAFKEHWFSCINFISMIFILLLLNMKALQNWKRFWHFFLSLHQKKFYLESIWVMVLFSLLLL